MYHTGVADNGKSRNMQIPCHADASNMQFLRGRERRNSALLYSLPEVVAGNAKLGQFSIPCHNTRERAYNTQCRITTTVHIRRTHETNPH